MTAMIFVLFHPAQPGAFGQSLMQLSLSPSYRSNRRHVVSVSLENRSLDAAPMHRAMLSKLRDDYHAQRQELRDRRQLAKTRIFAVLRRTVQRNVL
jgi:hypothetical protein